MGRHEKRGLLEGLSALEEKQKESAIYVYMYIFCTRNI